jgi:hypothetical protein
VTARGSRVSRLVAGLLAICIGLASVQVAWAETPERDHGPVPATAVAATAGVGAAVVPLSETAPEDGCAGLCLCACQCPHAQAGAAVAAVPVPAADPAPPGDFLLPGEALVSVVPTPRFRPPVV